MTTAAQLILASTSVCVGPRPARRCGCERRSIFKRERRETCELVYLCVVCYCARSGTPATIVFVLLLSFKTARSMRLCLVMMQTSDYRFVSSRHQIN